MPADHAHHQARARAGIAEIKGFTRLEQRAQSCPKNTPASLAQPFDLCAKLSAGAAGIQHVLAFEQSFNPRFADRQKAKQEGAMRNALVARRFYPSTQGTAGFCR